MPIRFSLVAARMAAILFFVRHFIKAYFSFVFLAAAINSLVPVY